MRTLKFILLPILGALAAVIAFRLAAPYEWGLDHRGLAEEDPRSLFTFGTKWGEVNRIAFGALICGPFAFVLALGRRSWPRVISAGVLGAALGGLINYFTDSSSDLIGLMISTKSVGVGTLIAMVAWCVLVPIGFALTLVLTQGITNQRVRRAIFAVRIAFIASLFVQFAGGMLAMPDADAENRMQSQIPVWRMVEIAVGIALGVTIVVADEFVRVATIRLMRGKNEFNDWSLDHAVNRIGSAEGCEIPIRGFADIQPVHATIVRQADRFILEAAAPTLVNGLAVTQTQLTSGDQIVIGTAHLVFSTRGGYYRAVPASQPFNQPAGQPIPQPIAQPYQPVPAQPIYPSPSGAAKVLQDAFGQQINLPPGRYGVGREATNAICLVGDLLVAANQAEIIVTDVGITLIDLNSGGKTRVNGVPLTTPANVRPGDIMEFGASRFSYLR